MEKIEATNFKSEESQNVQCSRLSTRGVGGTEGFKIGSNLVHVVVEWPLNMNKKTALDCITL
jgi:hypothetical protein